MKLSNQHALGWRCSLLRRVRLRFPLLWYQARVLGLDSSCCWRRAVHPWSRSASLSKVRGQSELGVEACARLSTVVVTVSWSVCVRLLVVGQQASPLSPIQHTSARAPPAPSPTPASVFWGLKAVVALQ